MSEINYQALREKAEKATKGSYIVGHTSVNQHGNLTGVFVCQKWKGEPGGVIAECHVNCLVETDAQAYANAEFIAAFNPNVALALLDERERNQQYIKSRDKENEDIALTVGKLRVELEAEEKTSAARLEALDRTHKMFQREQCRAEAAEKRIAELESGSQAQKLVEAIIVAIENEQERLFDEDYLMDSKECIDIIREEVKRWNDSRAAGIRIKGE
ncbi:ead/Ea22-like family protein [Escherichia coli]|uniref:EA22-like protein n=1 Tax=Escherichia coli TaxID=562 RepID=A0A376L6W4_ECOLX|nr:ead/Ea22-like family protein [Escherichia coli]EFP6125212.1 ead/Ea22-like family protein [Shigella flexneri]EHI3938182.1 ead/Ea22-like family protein [Shigella sonnei]EFF7023644.1 ead/Ea22-like family protein [Escherichia coli]EFH8259478.1 ead/Ea22-like family protein [Escherichia coli]EHR7664644.1 ead/Ea22-like family protein [Escherichia coli]